MTRSRLPVLLLVLVLGVVLFAGTRGDGSPSTPAARAEHLAQRVRCPTCSGISAAESNASASVAVRQEIRRRVDAGEADGQILAFLVGRYGQDILLTPSSSGVGTIVWVLPVAAAVLALAALAAAFRRWRPVSAGIVTEEDRALVARALER
ncbi:MAG: cytochrome c-type biogenesis protein CcmH [Acidimicrobiales bacterium]